MSLFKDAFSFRGRVNRVRYWRFILLIMFLELIIAVIVAALEQLRVSTPDNPIVAATETIVLIALGCPFFLTALVGNFAMTAKRLHDRNKSGWWQVVTYVASVFLVTVTNLHDRQQIASQIFLLAAVVGLLGYLVSMWIFVEVAFVRGTRGDNRFGPDPLASSG
jgi:uncharacterized membrane protein YhaH (DUF805 family)